jgi:hypothetical protein
VLVVGLVVEVAVVVCVVSAMIAFASIPMAAIKDNNDSIKIYAMYLY